MGTTPKLAIPYVEPADALANFPAASYDLAARLESLGYGVWTAFPSGVTGTARFKVILAVVFVQVDGSFSTTSAVQALLTTTPLPAAIRPTVQARAAGYFSGYPGTLTVTPGGDLSAVQQTGAARASVAGMVVYPLG